MSNSYCAASVVFAQVCWIGAASAGTINVPADKPTIQEAIDSAASGDTILIAAGTYAGPIDFKGKSVTVRGAGKETATIISGGSPVVKFTTNEGRNSVLQNLTVTGGTGFAGRGIQIVNASPAIVNCRIQFNRLTNSGYSDCLVRNMFGAGLLVNGGNPLISGCGIYANSSESSFSTYSGCGSGIACGGGIGIIAGGAEIENCRFSANAAKGDVGYRNSAYGGGLYKEGSGFARVTNCVFLNNDASGWDYWGTSQGCGGGVYFSGPGELLDCTVSNNSANGTGAGLFVRETGLFLTNSNICANTLGGSIGLQTAGLYIDLGGNQIGASCNAGCPSDLDQNHVVDTADLSLLLLEFGACP